MTSKNLITAREGTTLDEAERILGQHRIEKLPVVDAAGVLKGLITIKDIHKRRQFPDANKEMLQRLSMITFPWPVVVKTEFTWLVPLLNEPPPPPPSL